MSNRLELDHLVFGVPDLTAATQDLERCLGARPIPGGRHEGLGTHNAILPLGGETYLELIASDPEAPSPRQARPFGLDDLHSPRLVTWAVRSRSIESDVDHARERGFDPGMVFSMTRKEPDGPILRWKLSLRPKPFGGGLVPFVIDWGSTPHPTAARGNDSLDTDDTNDINEADSSKNLGDRGSTSACRLSGFSATHPDPEPIRAALDALGTRLELEAGADIQLHGRLTGPTGSIDL